MRHFLTLKDFSKAELYEIIALAFVHKRAKSNFKDFVPPHLRTASLRDKNVALIFEKPSTRTRVSFEAGINQLGGMAIVLMGKDTQIGRGEPISDTARVLSGMVDMVMVRTFCQETLEELARFSTIPVINLYTSNLAKLQGIYMRHFLTLKDFSKAELYEIIALAFVHKRAKSNFKDFVPPHLRTASLRDKNVALIFEKPSTRTRVSFEAGINQLGGRAIVLMGKDTQIGRGEPISDTARVLSGMIDMVMVRTFCQETLEELARFSTIPVINGLTDSYLLPPSPSASRCADNARMWILP